MKHIKTYEFFIFKKKKVKSNDSHFDIETVRDLLESDLEGEKFRGVDIVTFIKFENCRFKGSNGKPKLKHDKNWFGEEVSYSNTGHRDGEDGILMNYNSEYIDPVNMSSDRAELFGKGLDMREFFFLTNKIFKLINKERMTQFGIGYCINSHHYIGDGIVFYKL